MSKEFKAPRDIKTIQQEYSQLCMRAGDLQYKLVTLEKDLTVINDTLRDLNFEAAASNAAAQKSAEAEKAPETNVTPINQEAK